MSYTPITLVIPSANFIEAGLQIGDQVLMTGAPSNMFSTATPPAVDPNTFAGQFLVTSIVDAHTITYDGFINGDELYLNINGAATGTVTYTFVHNLSKDEQVALIVEAAQGYADKRVTLVWPPAAYATNADAANGVVTEGSFLAACLASAKSAYPAQQGFTNLEIPGPYQLLYSNTYFTQTQLKTLVDAGIFVFVQDAPGANIYALRQVTTDTSTFENMELSCVTAIDKFSSDVVSILKPYIGKYNIDDDYLTLLSDVADEYIYEATHVKAPMCGALMLGANLNSILANMNGSNPSIPDGTVLVNISCEVGKPGNWIQVTLLVS